MSAGTSIEWTDHTFNPWWGCARVSEGCRHCYAEALAKRFGHEVWGKGADRRFFGDKHWAEPLKWNRMAEAEGRRHRVFCASMADVFEDRDDLHSERLRLWALVEQTPWLDWQLLTKRPENVRGLVMERWNLGVWPHNVWIGTTVEDQQRADERIPHLLAIPAAVRFLSCEPLLGPVDLSLWPCPQIGHHCWIGGQIGPPRRVDWVIAGGESGPGARPMHPNWAMSLRDQCAAAGVPFFFKQVGGVRPKAAGRELDGRTWDEFPEFATP